MLGAPGDTEAPSTTRHLISSLQDAMSCGSLVLFWPCRQCNLSNQILAAVQTCSSQQCGCLYCGGWGWGVVEIVRQNVVLLKLAITYEIKAEMDKLRSQLLSIATK